MSLLHEPPELTATRPPWGWPRLVRRLEVCGAAELSDVAYDLARESRLGRHGVVAAFRGRDVYAWPHETVETIARTHLRLGAVADAISRRSGRWHPARKLALLDLVSVDTAQAEFEISPEELAEWRAGIDDLKRKAQPTPREAAA
jgi:hypothetical protein